jgi:hypothetical protein
MENLVIEVPADIKDDFLAFLDIAQSEYTQEEIKKLTKNEQKVIKFVEKILGNRVSGRFPSQKEKAVANIRFAKAVGLV